MENPSQTRLGTAPIGKLILQLSLPSVAAQLINVLYNIVDRIYIGHIEGIGDLALTGVGITFPIITLVSAFSSFAGAGGAPLAAIRLGAKDKDGAEKILGNSTFLLLCFSFVLTIFFQLFKTPLLMAFGASENIIGYGESYLGIYLWGTLFVQLALGLNTFISAQGNAKVAMLSVVIGAVINILLDPVFIFVFNMGVEGAALATILSQLVSAVWVLAFLCSKRSAIQLQLQAMRPKIKIIGRIARFRHLSVRHDGNRKSGKHYLKFQPAALWRRSACWSYDHPNQHYAAGGCPHQRVCSGMPAHYQL